MALRDAGDHAEILWDRPEVGHRGLPIQVGDGLLYAMVATPETGDAAGLAVVDLADGTILDLTPLPEIGPISMGSAVGTDGRVWVAGLRTGLVALHPVR